MTDRGEFDWLRELDCAERDAVDGWDGLTEAERAEIVRLDLEVCGLLPCALEPVSPSRACKESLMQQLDSRATLSVMPRVEVARPAPRRWLLPLAAALAVLAVGLSASLVSTVRAQRQELAALRERVEVLGSAADESAELAAGLAAAREKLALVSQRGVGICALRPTPAVAGSAGPHGYLFVAADHQHWYLRVEGLEPASDRYYRVWFETEDGLLVPAGNLEGEELELTSPSMPEGTRAVHVSLEREPAPEEPSDELLLFGDDMVQVL